MCILSAKTLVKLNNLLLVSLHLKIEFFKVNVPLVNTVDDPNPAIKLPLFTVKLQSS